MLETKEEKFLRVEQKQIEEEKTKILNSFSKPKIKQKRIFLKLEEKPLRRFPKGRGEITVKLPTKKGLGIETITIPEPQIEFREITFEKNPNLLSIKILNLKFTWRKDLKKGSIYDLEGKYLGSFSKRDFKYGWFQYSVFLREIKK